MCTAICFGDSYFSFLFYIITRQVNHSEIVVHLLRLIRPIRVLVSLFCSIQRSSYHCEPLNVALQECNIVMVLKISVRLRGANEHLFRPYQEFFRPVHPVKVHVKMPLLCFFLKCLFARLSAMHNLNVLPYEHKLTKTLLRLSNTARPRDCCRGQTLLLCGASRVELFLQGMPGNVVMCTRRSFEITLTWVI